MPQDPTHVVAGIISNDDGEILLAKRPPGAHQEGLWEFPGGKQELGEGIKHALERELMEELGLNVRKARPFIRLYYEYPDKSVILNVWLIQEWEGTPHGREGQVVQWYKKEDLIKVEILPANLTIIKAIQLPSFYLISPGPIADQMSDFISGIEVCINAGAKLLQLRWHEELYRTHPDVVEKILSVCNHHGAKLLLNTIPTTAVSLNAHGIHLNSVRLLQLNERPLGKSFLLSASCHNQNELAHAERIGVDFAVLSPVEYTTSHPDAAPMGWEKFRGMTEQSNIPVYALGGMQPVHMAKAWECGAQGIAMLSGVWSNGNPAEIIRQCINV